MPRMGLFFICLAIYFKAFGQSDTSSVQQFGSHVFLPSLEFGYMQNQAEALGGGILIKTSVEFRYRNNNDVFFRINYDTQTADYEFEDLPNLTNVIKGTANFSDVTAGVGYRFGETKWRMFLMAQAGVRFYDFPVAEVIRGTTTIANENRNLFITRPTLGLEYYFDEKTAIGFEILQSQIWARKDFWTDKGGAIGVSLGFITSLL